MHPLFYKISSTHLVDKLLLWRLQHRQVCVYSCDELKWSVEKMTQLHCSEKYHDTGRKSLGFQTYPHVWCCLPMSSINEFRYKFKTLQNLHKVMITASELKMHSTNHKCRCCCMQYSICISDSSYWGQNMLFTGYSPESWRVWWCEPIVGVWGLYPQRGPWSGGKAPWNWKQFLN